MNRVLTSRVDADTQIMRALRRKVLYLKALLHEAVGHLEEPGKFYDELTEEQTEQWFKKVERALRRR